MPLMRRLARRAGGGSGQRSDEEGSRLWVVRRYSPREIGTKLGFLSAQPLLPPLLIGSNPPTSTDSSELGHRAPLPWDSPIWTLLDYGTPFSPPSAWMTARPPSPKRRCGWELVVLWMSDLRQTFVPPIVGHPVKITQLVVSHSEYHNAPHPPSLPHGSHITHTCSSAWGLLRRRSPLPALSSSGTSGQEERSCPPPGSRRAGATRLLSDGNFHKTKSIF